MSETKGKPRVAPPAVRCLAKRYMGPRAIVQCKRVSRVNGLCWQHHRMTLKRQCGF